MVSLHYGIPLHIIRDLVFTLRSFLTRFNDMLQYRRATANMNERYPDATQEELIAIHRVCIICREEMDSGKKLPCGHIFHFNCLRSWLERQQTCPTCRRSVLSNDNSRNTRTPANPNANQQQAAQPQGGAQQGVQGQQNQHIGGIRFQIRPVPIIQLPNLMPVVGQQVPPNSDANNPQPPPIGVGGTVLYPLSMFNRGPIGVGGNAMPAPAAPLEELSEEQLRAMEGNERRHIEERIRFLQGIQQQISGIVVQLTQYQQIIATDASTSANPVEQSSSSSSTIPNAAAAGSNSAVQQQYSFGASNTN
jgi:E3 ubiquitin-protein ligase synoviolin